MYYKLRKDSLKLTQFFLSYDKEGKKEIFIICSKYMQGTIMDTIKRNILLLLITEDTNEVKIFS